MSTTAQSGQAPTRKVSLLLAIGIIFVPIIFAWFLLRKGYSGLARGIGFCWLALTVIMYAASPKQDAPQQPAPAVNESAAQPKPHVAPIADDAVIALTKASYPKAFKAWGSEWIAKINDLQPKVAELASKAPDCKTVQSVALSDSKSDVRKTPAFFVDCPNDVRIIVRPSDVESGVVPESENAKLAKLDDVDLIIHCSDRTRMLMKYPSSYDQKALSSGVSRAGWGRAVVKVAFEAKNDFGGELPGMATCTVDGDTMSMPEIANR